MRAGGTPRLPIMTTRPERHLPPEATERIEWLRKTYAHVYPDIWEKLLAAAGDAAVVPPLGWFAGEFLARGELMKQPVRKGRGRASECHRNASRYFRSDPQRYRIVSGFALSQDTNGVGCWVPHSWTLDTRAGEIVETTLPRTLYYGLELSGDRAETFARQYD